ncbi:MAG TPA: hypothetical protein VJR94_03915 [Candidatus Nitrosocosmicus sp.]|nr:hypothetical protein [Candidatus Nitrosocosmicus sp.]
MKSEKKKSLVFGMIFIFGIMMLASSTSSDRVNAQTNSTLNQGQTNSTLNQTQASISPPTTTTSAQKEASQSIKGAITETGEFVGNVTQKIINSKSAGTILNETSEVLGDAYLETKKFFSP